MADMSPGQIKRRAERLSSRQISDSDRVAITARIKALRKAAAPVGSMSPLWDFVSSMEQFLDGDEMYGGEATAAQLINETNKYVNG